MFYLFEYLSCGSILVYHLQKQFLSWWTPLPPSPLYYDPKSFMHRKDSKLWKFRGKDCSWGQGEIGAFGRAGHLEREGINKESRWWKFVGCITGWVNSCLFEPWSGSLKFEILRMWVLQSQMDLHAALGSIMLLNYEQDIVIDTCCLSCFHCIESIDVI